VITPLYYCTNSVQIWLAVSRHKRRQYCNQYHGEVLAKAAAPRSGPRGLPDIPTRIPSRAPSAFPSGEGRWMTELQEVAQGLGTERFETVLLADAWRHDGGVRGSRGHDPIPLPSVRNRTEELRVPCG